ncbi:MAG: SIS domain-containing protein [Desulfobacterales bacterium]|nr:SIS domain-containing protein [Desulfobacterales bacterium]MDP6683474.1 SIS domain-containing protein [Desulfobacterales bacterium]MDP6807300.1 SIS domain-containing protein [Desulfobacterales bacterium]
MKSLNITICFLKQTYRRCLFYLQADIYFGKNLAGIPKHSFVLFPFHSSLLSCGLMGIVAYKRGKEKMDRLDLSLFEDTVRRIKENPYPSHVENESFLDKNFFQESQLVSGALKAARELKTESHFYEILIKPMFQDKLLKIGEHISNIIHIQEKWLAENMGDLIPDAVDAIAERITHLKDISWCISSEILNNIPKVKELSSNPDELLGRGAIKVFQQINAVMNSLDRLEVRGRDSAGISLMFILKKEEFENRIASAGLRDHLNERTAKNILLNMGITISETKEKNEKPIVTVTLTYKVAIEIGSLGDNVKFLRGQIKEDAIVQMLIPFTHEYFTILSHTRWASVGAITEANCHPVDNRSTGNRPTKDGIIHICLNGDIDNYTVLRTEIEKSEYRIPPDVTTDTKIIPLQIQSYLQKGHEIEEAFRMAVNRFEGSHAISMHTNLAPGKIFLAQKGSGQAIFIGLGENYYIPTSEVYGFVEETPIYLKMDGEKAVTGRNGKTQGQIFILSQKSIGGLDGIKAMFYDGTPVKLEEADKKQTDITSRDIDRLGYPHYFLKEISEAPVSVERTLRNRWKIKEDGNKLKVVTLDAKAFPKYLKTAFVENQIQRIYFVGQGTAGVAAQVCADILNYYMDNPLLHINALKASELSGFKLSEHDGRTKMANTLVVAISQSGTTTDTNRTIDMVRKRGAYTMAIVNRRDSDITFKVDGIIYTSSGRDIEMSVASTKAFYSQIVAGAILGLYIADLKGRRNKAFVDQEITQLLELPKYMKKILSMKKEIKNSAERLSLSKTDWAAVGSGPNKASADEIRIKLSELCYKTISSDYVEDKKHIDLSSEPLIIVCAAGTKGTVIGDISKDTAIFHAHKATPVVIANEGENRFDPYAADIFHVPVVSQHLAPLVNTLVGHIWGYYAALAINDGSLFLYRFREELQKMIDDHAEKGMDIYEVILDKSFREKIAYFYSAFRKKKAENRLPSTLGIEAAADLPLILKYLSGRLPVSDFELDFGQKGTARNMLNLLFKSVGESINHMARPVDAIKHQAKTVTVGTSRISEKVEGILFESLFAQNFSLSQSINRNIIVMKNLQSIIYQIKGSVLYRIKGLNLLGEPDVETTIEIIDKSGTSLNIPSRVEKDHQLKGTKRIIVQEGNVYIGKGRKDDRSIIIIPIISDSHAMPNMIEYLLLLNISFKEQISLDNKIKALGGKYERIIGIVQENSIGWDETYLELVTTDELFGRSAEKIGESIVTQLT